MPETCAYIAPWLARATIYGLASSTPADQRELIVSRLSERNDFLAEDDYGLFTER